MTQPSPAIDLAAYRKAKELQAFVAAHSPAVPSFNWEDVTFYGDTEEPVPDTIVVYGPLALSALRIRMAKCGLSELPTRYQELLGTLAYCQELLQAAQPIEGHKEADRLSWQESQLQVCAEYTPELLPSLTALFAGDLAELQRIGREVMVPATLARHFVIDKGCWMGAPALEHLAREAVAAAAPAP